MMEMEALRDQIISCKKCPRLVDFRENVLKDSKKYRDVEFWRKPLTGYGDINGSILLIGLAPAASGGNRTGRVFTGDKSSDFLISCLYEAGITNMPTSTNAGDGLEYIDAYISLSVRCVPPDNKPERNEINNCHPYLKSEFDMMHNVKSLIVLGKIAFDSAIRLLKERGYGTSGVKFVNNGIYDFEDIRLYCLFHPSPRNVNTGRINRDEFVNTLKEARSYSSRGKKY